MTRHDKKAYELNDAEKRDLIKLIERGLPLPEKYRFVLFEDKREVELVWNGKTRDVCTTVLPFQALEHANRSRNRPRFRAACSIRAIWGVPHVSRPPSIHAAPRSTGDTPRQYRRPSPTVRASLFWRKTCGPLP
jgi:hypothetical protein